MPSNGMPEKFHSLHEQEEFFRSKALELIAANSDLALHLAVVESAMDLTDLLWQVPLEDEDFKVLQLLSIRIFNAFGASLKLALSGYSQNSVLVMRDIMETVFLMDMFGKDRSAIKQWREAESAKERDRFRPINVRKFLDDHDGFTSGKRAENYKMFSELAGHPSMKSMRMLHPQIDYAVRGPFMEFKTLQAVLSEMAKLAVQVGEIVSAFFPDDFDAATASRVTFDVKKVVWIKKFYGSSFRQVLRSYQAV